METPRLYKSPSPLVTLFSTFSYTLSAVHVPSSYLIPPLSSGPVPYTPVSSPSAAPLETLSHNVCRSCRPRFRDPVPDRPNKLTVVSPTTPPSTICFPFFFPPALHSAPLLGTPSDAPGSEKEVPQTPRCPPKTRLLSSKYTRLCAKLSWVDRQHASSLTPRPHLCPSGPFTEDGSRSSCWVRRVSSYHRHHDPKTLTLPARCPKRGTLVSHLQPPYFRCLPGAY